MEMDFVKTAHSSCFISIGKTRVICTASVEESVPPFLRGHSQGWITAEYARLPASTGKRKNRDGLQKDGRGVEIQRIIGRSLRQAVNLSNLGERTIILDCDVIQADGGTRTAAITGAYAALVMAIHRLIQKGALPQNPLIAQIAAISIGIVDDTPALDLCYAEDSLAQADINLVMNQKGEFVELQGTAEGRAFTAYELETLLTYGRNGIRCLMRAQRSALLGHGSLLAPLPRIVVASNNAHKIHELSRIFQGVCEVAGMSEAGCGMKIEETGHSFEENAVLKAETVMNATGLPVLADDSGLSVNALNGAPGIYSARYSGAHGSDQKNNELLIENMKNITDRRCKFTCALALALPGDKTYTVCGECEGLLLEEPRGEKGFGYDPLFLYKTGKTFAQMGGKEKNTVSHRAQAAEKMRTLLSDVL